MTQPKIDGYISWLRRNDHFGMTSCIYDDKSQKLLDELFALLEQIAPESPTVSERSGFVRKEDQSRISAMQRRKSRKATMIRKKNL